MIRFNVGARLQQAFELKDIGQNHFNDVDADCMADLDNLLLYRRLDRLLAPWRRAGGPGVTVGLVLGQELLVHESAGMASVELGVPIGPATTFRIASVGKQFPRAAILLLATEGKLSLDDDVRDHIPALPDLGDRITVAHLM